MNILPWKKISSKVVFQHPRLTLVEDAIELPDGKPSMYIMLSPTEAYSVCAIAINDKQEMLLQKEFSYPPNEVLWQLPGGGGDEGEDVIMAANRELSEESGYIGRQCKLIGSYYLDNRRSPIKQFVVLCTDLEEKVGHKDDEEFIETIWVPLSQIRSYVQSGEFKNASLLAALNVYFAVTEK